MKTSQAHGGATKANKIQQQQQCGKNHTSTKAASLLAHTHIRVCVCMHCVFSKTSFGGGAVGAFLFILLYRYFSHCLRFYCTVLAFLGNSKLFGSVFGVVVVVLVCKLDSVFAKPPVWDFVVCALLMLFMLFVFVAPMRRRLNLCELCELTADDA